MRNTFISRFTPSMMGADVLEEIFVQRERLAARTVRQVRDGALTGPPAHVLFVGPRGIGKTHLISLIYHRLKATEELQGRLAVAWLPEDEGGIASFLHLLIAVLKALRQDDPALTPWLGPRLEALYDRPTEAEALALVREAVGDRALLLMVENLDDVFAGLKDAGQKALRAFLQETRSVTLLASAQSLFGGVSRHVSPFYGFFRVEHLPGLTPDEAVELLTKIAEHEEKTGLAAFLGTPAGRARVRAVDRLVAGTPRLYVIFSEFLARKEDLDALVPPFLDMLDDLTPYYQAKMRSLSPQQRSLVDFLSGAQGALPVKEIARRTLMGATTAANQLKLLRELGYVRVAHSKGRETYYELKEPLMRLCLGVKKQREGPINLFVEFLRVWCPREELEQRLADLSGEAPFTRAALREALRLSATGESPLIAACRADYAQYMEQDDQEQAGRVLEEWQAIAGPDAPDFPEQPIETEASKTDQLMMIAGELFGRGLYKEALAAWERCLVLAPEHVVTWYNKGLVLVRLGRWQEALVAWEQSIVLDPKHAGAWLGKGVALGSLGRSEEALAALDECLMLNPDDASIWYSRGLALDDLRRFEEAVSAYERCTSLVPQDAGAWYTMGLALDRLNRFGEALAACEQCLSLAPEHSAAWYSKGMALVQLDYPEEALAAFEQCLALDPKRESAWYSKALTLGTLGRFEEALADHERRVALKPQDADAWYWEGMALLALGRFEEALVAWKQCLILAPQGSDAWYWEGIALLRSGRPEEALAAFDHALQLQAEQPQWSMARVEALFALNRWEEGFASLRDALPLFGDVPEALTGSTADLVHLMLAGDLNHWPVRAEAFAAAYATHEQALALGQALVQSVSGLRSTLISPDARRLWHETWRERTAGRSEFTLPLRLLDVAVRFLNSGDPLDVRVLLELQAEERGLLRPLLGMSEDEEDEEG